MSWWTPDSLPAGRSQAGDHRLSSTNLGTTSASAPNEVFIWDITKLHGPEKWTSYYLLVCRIIDIYSRYVPGWMLARAERGTLAEALREETIQNQGVGP